MKTCTIIWCFGFPSLTSFPFVPILPPKVTPDSSVKIRVSSVASSSCLSVFSESSVVIPPLGCGCAALGFIRGFFYTFVSVFFCLIVSSFAQLPAPRAGDAIPRDMREIYDRGLQFLISKQAPTGEFAGGGEQGAGVTGMALMVLLASGEDPNFGLYASNVRRAVKSIITQQNAGTGILGSSMYHHGFAMLGLAEAYGTVDDRDLFTAKDGQGRSIGPVAMATRGRVFGTAGGSL